LGRTCRGSRQTVADIPQNYIDYKEDHILIDSLAEVGYNPFLASLSVKAKDKATSKEQHITITDSSALKKEEIEKMKKEAEAHAAEDRQRKELIEVRNQADTLIYSTEKALKETGDKVKPEDKKEVEDKLAELKKLKDGSEIEPLKKGLDELSQAIQKIGAQLYQKVQEEKAEQAEPEIKKGHGKEKTVEGEYEEVKDSAQKSKP